MATSTFIPAPLSRSETRVNGKSTRASWRTVPPAGSPLTRIGPKGNDRGVVDSKHAPYALLVLRLTLAGVFLQHVMRIVFGYEPADITQLFGLPAGVSAYSLAWDALIGLALLYGIWPRLAAIAGAVTLSIAAIASHGAASASPFGWQLPVLWVTALLAFALAGDGAFALVPTASGDLRTARVPWPLTIFR